MTYEEAIDYIFTPTGRRPSPRLGRMRKLLAALGDPQARLKFVHVAGTNGKGSTCAMLESILRASGYKTGLFTSPHLSRFNERIKVDGRDIGDGELTAACERVRAAAETLSERPTVFEIITAIALLHFAEKKCAIVVLEVGIGGRLDCTNVIESPDCAVICSIGLDHTELLGATLPEIAGEKAGIIKPGCAAAMYQSEDPEVTAVVAAACRTAGASLRIADFDEIEILSDGLEGQSFLYCGEGPYFIPLLGDHQSRNAAVVLEAVEILRERGWRRISAEAVEKGLAATVWPARFEIVSRDPWVVVDGGHNPQCALAVAENLDYYFEGMRHVILIGMLGDKDAAGFGEALAPSADVFVCFPTQGDRALSAKALGEKLRGFGRPVLLAASAEEGLETAIAAAGGEGVVCVTGSLHTVGEIRAHFGL